MPRYKNPQWEAYKKASATRAANHKASRQILRALARARRARVRLAADPAHAAMLESMLPMLQAWASSQVSKYHACRRRMLPVSDLDTLHRKAVAETSAPKEVPR